jgi:Ca2+-binding EF-hand superfamily protein
MKHFRGWYKGFRADCPDGNLHKSKILEIYNMILPNGDSSVFVDQIFRIFDKDGNGYIDFKEFMLATDMTKTGTPEEKLKWAFKVIIRRKYMPKCLLRNSFSSRGKRHWTL